MMLYRPFCPVIVLNNIICIRLKSCQRNPLPFTDSCFTELFCRLNGEAEYFNAALHNLKRLAVNNYHFFSLAWGTIIFFKRFRAQFPFWRKVRVLFETIKHYVPKAFLVKVPWSELHVPITKYNSDHTTLNAR